MEPFTNGKLYYYLEALEGQEQLQLQTWINGGIFGSEPGQQLLGILVNHLIQGTAQTLTHQFLAQQLFRNLPNALSRMHKEYNQALQCLMKFFAWSAFQTDTAAEQTFLMETLMARTKTKYLATDWKKAKEKIKISGEASLQATVKLQAIHYELDLHTLGRSIATTVQPTLDAVDVYFVYLKLRHFCRAQNQDNIVNSAHQLRLSQDLEHLMHDTSLKFPPIVMAYWALYNTLLDEANICHYTDLKALLADHSATFPISERREFTDYLQNYLGRKINAGQKEFQPELADLYGKSLQAGVLLSRKGKLTAATFKNIAFTYLDIGKIAEAKTFVAKFKNQIEPPQEQAVATNLVDGRIAYMEGRFQTAINHLNQVIKAYDDVFFGLNARILLCRSYLDACKFDLLDNELEAFRKYIERNKEIALARRKDYSTLIKYFNKLSTALQKQDQKIKPALLKLQTEMNSLALTNNLSWIAQRVDKETKARS